MRVLLNYPPLVLAISLMLQGCSAIPTSAPSVKPVPIAPPEADVPKIRVQTPEQMAETRARIEQDPIYLILAGELEGQSDNLPQAADFYFAAAQQSNDVALIARATQIELIAKRYDLAFKTAQRWTELAPTSDKATATLTISAVQMDNFAAADRALTHWLERADNDQTAVFNELGAYLDKNVPQKLAIRYTDHLARQFPSQVTAQLIVAKLDLKFGRMQTAITAARQVIVLDPRNETARDILIVALNQTNDNAGLIDALKAANQQFPGTDRYVSGLIEAYIRSGDTHQAGKLLETALRKPIKDPAQLRNLALFALQIERPALAQKVLLKLGKLPDQHDLAQLLLGRLAAQSGELNSAIKYFNRVSLGSEHYAEARILMAAAYAQSGDISGAMQSLDIALDQSIDIADKQRLTLAKAGLLQSQGLDQEALTLLTEAITLWPSAHDIQLQRAMLLLKFNRNFEARDTLRQVIKEDPNNAAALNALGFTLADENIDLVEAHELIQKALTIEPDNAAYLDSMGWVLYRQGQLDQAAETLARAFKITPDPEVGAHLGIVLWQQNKTAEAKAIWQRALTLNPNLPILRDAVRKYAPELLLNLPASDQ
ncbi:MAG: tetratricopeptide repeat protein [Halothiobacillus sp.]